MIECVCLRWESQIDDRSPCKSGDRYCGPTWKEKGGRVGKRKDEWVKRAKMVGERLNYARQANKWRVGKVKGKHMVLTAPFGPCAKVAVRQRDHRKQGCRDAKVRILFLCCSVCVCVVCQATRKERETECEENRASDRP